MTYLSDRVLDHLRAVSELPDLSGTRYELIREIGRGGMGAVYLVMDHELKRHAALKVLGRGDVAEAQVIASLEHPGIIPVHDSGQLPDGRGYYVMRFVEGPRLDHVRSAQPLLSERLRIFQKVCDAVSFAHSRGVIHRDLKPENIVAGPFGEVFILDWGVARVQNADRERPGMIVGTPAFMAPEQASGRSHEAGVEADVYSLGALLEFLLDADGPRALRSVARKAKSAEPAERYDSPAGINREISRYLEGEAVEAHRETMGERLGRWAAHNKTLLLLMAAYLIVKFALYFLRFL